MKRKYLLDGFAPRSVLRRFEDICAIPHGSGNEAALGAYICDLAARNGLKAERDEAGNILVWMPASSGYEKAAPLLVQGHIDMVCVRDPGVTTDLGREPVPLVLEGNILRAEGTSLGADNAAGVSAMLALMDDPALPHPPLELLFTTGEETGLVGIRRFDMQRLRARRMINMDCGDPDVLTVGSAGSAKYLIERDGGLRAFSGRALRVAIGGLAGGHSGIEAGKNRASAVDLAGRLLSALSDGSDARLIALDSEDGATSIPRRASLTLGASDVSAARGIIGRMDAQFRAETAGADPGYRMDVYEAEAGPALTRGDTRALADLMLLVPYEVTRRANENLSWPLCSSLLTGVKLTDGNFSAVFAVRANLDAYREACVARLEALLRLCGARYTLLSEAPAWPMTEASPFRTLCLSVYERLFGEPMRLELIHGTLEVGVIKAALPDMDIVGFAPKSRGAHTTDERLYVDTVLPFWNYLKAVLAALKY